MSEIWPKMSGGLGVKYPLLLSDFNEIRIFSTVFRKIQNIRFHENPSSGSWGVPYWQAGGWEDV